MVYIYDILLNWNKDLYYFYEWEKSDELVHIKKMPIFKVTSNNIKDIINNTVKIDKEFINKIYNLSEFYTTKKVSKINYAFILSDGNISIAINTNKDGYIKYRSTMLIEEEEETFMLIKRLNIHNLKYEISGKVNNNILITRYEKRVKDFLENEIIKTYKKNDKDKLKYLYIEYFNVEIDDINTMYNELLLSLNNIDDNHKKIYGLLQLITNNN